MGSDFKDRACNWILNPEFHEERNMNVDVSREGVRCEMRGA
jgi:hypothetical protein